MKKIAEDFFDFGDGLRFKTEILQTDNNSTAYMFQSLYLDLGNGNIAKFELGTGNLNPINLRELANQLDRLWSRSF